MHRFITITLAAIGLSACATPDRLAVTTVSPGKCFYDSNVNQQRCRHDVAMTGRAAVELRSPRHDIDLARNPFAFFDILSEGGQQSSREPGYTYGYNAAFEAGYRTPERFDTTVYEGVAVATPRVTPVMTPLPRRHKHRSARRPVYKD